MVKRVLIPKGGGGSGPALQQLSPALHRKRNPLTAMLLQTKVGHFLFLVAIAGIVALQFHFLSLWRQSNNNNNHYGGAVEFGAAARAAKVIAAAADERPQRGEDRCAINFFGLPRAFKSLVLPSLEKNVIRPNAAYRCDYFVHYYHKTEEAPGRSGRGGAIDPTEILALEAAVEGAAKRSGYSAPVVKFVHDTDEAFFERYGALLEKIRNTKRGGHYYYFPWRARTYEHPVTVDNIVKMWHSIQSAWDLMDRHQRDIGGPAYSTVAMLRSDVVYVTPVDLFAEVADGADGGSASSATAATTTERRRSTAVVPDFGKYPVSDRIIYGPAAAVKIWAAERFNLLERHVEYIYRNDPGWGMHSERFLNTTIFPAIRQAGIPIQPHPTLCFLRARADDSVWITDCQQGDAAATNPAILRHLGGDVRSAVERTIGRKCGAVTRLSRVVRSLDCRPGAENAQKVAAEAENQQPQQTRRRRHM